jgi:hypothetical protein
MVNSLKPVMISKLLISFLFTFFIALATTAQNYPAVIKFTSECCGVPDSKPVFEFVRSFRKQHKIKKVIAYRIAPLGREGEYDLAFPLKEMTKSQSRLFRTKLTQVCSKLKGQGKATVAENETINKADLPQRATIEKIII